jgi:hypothetical protein
MDLRPVLCCLAAALGAADLAVAVDTPEGRWYPLQPVPVTLRITAPVRLAAIADLRIDLPEVATPGLRAVLPEGPLDRPDSVGLPLAGRRVAARFVERRARDGAITTELTCRLHLIAQRPGAVALPRGSVSCTLDRRPPPRGGDAQGPAYFHNRLFGPGQPHEEPATAAIPARTLAITDFALPPPAGYAGLVGAPSLLLATEPTQAMVGQAMTLTARIAHPDAARIPVPTLADQPAWNLHLRLVGQPTISADDHSLTIRQTAWPLRPETTMIPPLTAIWYDPEAGLFRTATSAPVPVTITAGPDATADLRTADGRLVRQVVAPRAAGPHHQEWDASLLRPPLLLLPLDTLAWSLFWGAPLLAVGVLAARRIARAWQAGAAARRRRTAAIRCRRRLHQVADPAPLVVLADLGDAYLRDRLGGIHDDGRPLVAAWLARCDRARYAADGAATQASHADLLAVIDALEGGRP